MFTSSSHSQTHKHNGKEMNVITHFKRFDVLIQLVSLRQRIVHLMIDHCLSALAIVVVEVDGELIN